MESIPKGPSTQIHKVATQRRIIAIPNTVVGTPKHPVIQSLEPVGFALLRETAPDEFTGTDTGFPGIGEFISRHPPKGPKYPAMGYIWFLY